MWGILSYERMYLSFTRTMLLGLARAVTLGSESRRNHDHILLSHLKLPPAWRARSPYLYPPGTGWPSYTPGHWVPLSSRKWRYSNPPPHGVCRTRWFITSSTCILCWVRSGGRAIPFTQITFTKTDLVVILSFPYSRVADITCLS
jgi:hypothetical protein